MLNVAVKMRRILSGKQQKLQSKIEVQEGAEEGKEKKRRRVKLKYSILVENLHRVALIE